MTTSETYNFDRKAASKLLRISIRTLDRYIKNRKLSTRLVGGRVWLDKRELMRFHEDKERPITIDRIEVSTPDVSIDDDIDNIDEGVSTPGDRVQSFSKKRERKLTEDGVYKNLFIELREELQEKQERLEIANYRVGQLEAQVKSSVPMLEYHAEKAEKKRNESELKEEIIKVQKVTKKLKRTADYERFNKRAFLIILMTILALQPLWLLLLDK
jgi:hypothetical protein